MCYENELQESRARLSKLKANIHVWAIQKYIDELRKKWRPMIRIIEGPVNHSCDENELSDATLYWDIVNAKWKDRESAFRAYVIREIEKLGEVKNSLHSY